MVLSGGDSAGGAGGTPAVQGERWWCQGDAGPEQPRSAPRDSHREIPPGQSASSTEPALAPAPRLPSVLRCGVISNVQDSQTRN